MGGGDLNSKKSWHPNTMKNQERVWKAEQAAAEEKKRILELQRERAEERDRSELNSMIKQNSASGSGTSDNRLHWMYDKPDRKAQQEDYLLGKSIEKNYDNVEKHEHNIIPAVARRVVGSSMLSASGDSQVDLARKLREDPLLLVKERERAARAALLNNPLQRRRLTELLRKEQENKKDHKSKKKTKKKDKDLDKQLAAKLNALGGEKGLNLATLLESDDSDSDSSSSSEEEKPKKKKKKHKQEKTKRPKKKSKKKKHSSSEQSSGDEKHRRAKRESKEVRKQINHVKVKESRKRKSDNDSSENESNWKKSRYSSEKYSKDDRRKKDEMSISKHNREDNPRSQSYHRSNENSNKRDRSSDRYQKDKIKERYDRDSKRSKGAGMSSEQRAAALAAMAAAGVERERQRGRRVAEQRAAAAAPAPRRPHAAHEARMLPDSLEARIHSNRHYIQRNQSHMDQHFARR